MAHLEWHMTRRISSREKEEQRIGLSHVMSTCPCSCSRHEDVFFYINIAKDYKSKLIEDIKSCVDHDGD
jgi:GTP cyclohydrolase FolE2